MKKVLMLFLLILFSDICYSQTLFVEEFNYTAGDLLTAHNWIQSGSTTTNPLTVTTPGLTYTGYPSVAGNSSTLAATGQDVYQSFTPVSSGDVYISFLLNVQSAGTGDYFIALSNSSSQTNYYLRMHIKSSGSGYLMGLSKSNEVTGGSLYGTTVLNFNTTYLVVAKHTFIATATTDDIENIFVFNSPTIPSTEPSTPEVGPYTNATKTDPTDLGYVTIRQGTSGASAQLIIDGIRLATSWSTLLPPQSGLSAPVATAATNISSNGFTTNWSSVNTATNYFLDISTASDFSTFVPGFNMKDVGNVTSYDVTGLDPNTTFYYRVHASDGTNASANSNTITVVSIVAAPIATAATNITTTGFTANWNSSAGATKYLLDVSTLEDFSTFVTDYNNKDIGNVTSFAVTSLNTGNTYYYRVRASNANGTSINSNSISTITGQLSAPVANSATNVTTTDFTASWNNSQSATTYFLDVSTTSDFSTFVTNYNAKEVGNVTNYKVTSVVSSTVYYYRVRASNNGGMSGNSNIISVTTLLAAPVATAATNISTTGFTSNWIASNGATNYWIDVSTTDDFANVLATYNNKSMGNVTTFNITSLTINTTYYFRVCCSNNTGTSPYSNTITIVLKTTGVGDLEIIPNRFDLYQNYPNPFNPSTTIKYQVPENTFVSIKIYNVLGCVVSTLVSDVKSAGTYDVKFDASQLTSGIYIYKIQAGNYLQTKKMILVK